MGAGLVRTFKAEGYTVVVPSRSREKLDALAHEVGGGLELIETDVSDPKASREAAQQVATTYGTVSAVVTALGGWSKSGPLLELGLERWAGVLADNLTSHVVAAQAFAPLLTQAKGTYLMINGGAAEKPAKDFGPVSIAAAAQAMLMRVIDQELAASGARAITLLINSVVNTGHRADAKPDWITAEEVARLAVLLVSSDAAPFAGQIVRAGELRLRA